MRVHDCHFGIRVSMTFVFGQHVAAWFCHVQHRPCSFCLLSGMYPHVLKAVQSNEVLLEWDHKQGKAPKPLLKVGFGLLRLVWCPFAESSKFLRNRTSCLDFVDVWLEQSCCNERALTSLNTVMLLVRTSSPTSAARRKCSTSPSRTARPREGETAAAVFALPVASELIHRCRRGVYCRFSSLLLVLMSSSQAGG
jgi:hypothetical protein